MWDVVKPETGSRFRFATLWPPVGKSIWRHNSVGDHPIRMKFSTPIQNHMSMTLNRSTSKPWLECQHRGRLFSETGSSNIPAVEWNIWSKCSMQMVFRLHKCEMSPNRKPEVNLRQYGRHLGKSIWHHNSVADGPIRMKFGRPCRIICWWRR